MASNADNLEVEVKFFVPDLNAIREQLVQLGVEVTKPRIFEQNVRYDTMNEELFQEWKLLRLRQDNVVTVTFKGEPQEEVTSEARVREELEVQVSDFETMAMIFERIGFYPVQSYEKYRETFIWGNVEVVLDELPYGDFVELEGEETALKTAVSQLGLDWQKRILTNYLGLMQQLKDKHDLPFTDLTFANFEDLTISAADILP